MTTGSRQSFLFASLASAALALSPACVQAADGVLQPHTITVAGEGEVKVVPDEAILTAGVVSQGATAHDAVAANRRAMSGVFAELKRQGVPEKSIETAEFNVSPQYDSGRHVVPKIIGYQATNDVSVTLDDLAKLGSTVDALVSSGANSMWGISFTIRDPKPLQKAAREAAVKDAIDKAQTYAQAAGLALGPVVQIDEVGRQSPRPVFANRILGGAAGFDASTPIAAGEQTLSAQVTVTFEIK